MYTSPTDTVGGTTVTTDLSPRRFALIGMPADVAEHVAEYVERLNQAQLVLAEQYPHLLNDDGSLREYFDVDPEATGAGKYVRVVRMEPSWRDGTIRAGSVHAFVEKATGKVMKPGGWKSPQREKNGLAVRYDLTDDESRQKMLATLDTYGSYLYKR